MAISWRKLLYSDSPAMTGTGTAVELKGNGMFQKQSVATGETLTVPVGYSMVVAGDFSVVGDLVVNGDMRVM